MRIRFTRECGGLVVTGTDCFSGISNTRGRKFQPDDELEVADIEYEEPIKARGGPVRKCTLILPGDGSLHPDRIVGLSDMCFEELSCQRS